MLRLASTHSNSEAPKDYGTKVQHAVHCPPGLQAVLAGARGVAGRCFVAQKRSRQARAFTEAAAWKDQ